MGKTLASFGEKERRLHERVEFNGDAMVFLGKDTGTILDISKSGLAVRITLLDSAPLELSHLDIFFAEPRFYLPNLPVCLINEISLSSNSIVCLLQIKRLGIKFGYLDKEQRSLLDQFIANHATLTNW